MGIPTNCQTETSASVVSAAPSWPSQGENRLRSPMASSMLGAMPHSGDRISFQTNPTITKDRMVGIKIAVR